MCATNDFEKDFCKLMINSVKLWKDNGKLKKKDQCKICR